MLKLPAAVLTALALFVFAAVPAMAASGHAVNTTQYQHGTWVETDMNPVQRDPAGSDAAPADGAVGLVYLDVWRRYVCAVVDDRIWEMALGGPDTDTRDRAHPGRDFRAHLPRGGQ